MLFLKSLSILQIALESNERYLVKLTRVFLLQQCSVRLSCILQQPGTAVTFITTTANIVQ